MTVVEAKGLSLTTRIPTIDQQVVEQRWEFWLCFSIFMMPLQLNQEDKYIKPDSIGWEEKKKRKKERYMFL